MERLNPLRLLTADLSLRRPGFAILCCESGKVSVEKLCHLDSRKAKSCHGEVLSAIYEMMTE